LGSLLFHAGRLDEVELLARRALRILVLFALQSGDDHWNLQGVQRNYVACLKAKGFSESEIAAELGAVDAEARAQLE
jgi:hypothetical protein